MRYLFRIIASLLCSGMLAFSLTAHSSSYIYEYDYYDTYDYGYDDADYTDDWFYDYYDYGDAFSDPEYEYDYDWVENEYEWEEDDLFFDDDL